MHSSCSCWSLTPSPTQTSSILDNPSNHRWPIPTNRCTCVTVTSVSSFVTTTTMAVPNSDGGRKEASPGSRHLHIPSSCKQGTDHPQLAYLSPTALTHPRTYCCEAWPGSYLKARSFLTGPGFHSRPNADALGRICQ